MNTEKSLIFSTIDYGILSSFIILMLVLFSVYFHRSKNFKEIKGPKSLKTLLIYLIFIIFFCSILVIVSFLISVKKDRFDQISMYSGYSLLFLFVPLLLLIKITAKTVNIGLIITILLILIGISLILSGIINNSDVTMNRTIKICTLVSCLISVISIIVLSIVKIH